MTDRTLDINARVKRIHELYEQLHGLSNDELRTKVCTIREEIRNEGGTKQATDRHLEAVYALVKETARRFTQGKITVTANDYDRQLAEQYDFVRIEGDQAVWSDRWKAGGVERKWCMIHYDCQVEAGICLHEGHAVEMATGEGKTLVGTLPVFLNALTGKGVHMMTVNDYLSRRDCEQMRPLYMLYGLTVDCIEYGQRIYGTARKKAYAADITYGTNSSFAFDYLFDHIALNPDECVQREHHYAVIDELDGILIDEADDPHLINGPGQHNQGKHYTKYLPVIREMVEQPVGTLYHADRLTKSVTLTPEGEKWLEEKCGLSGLWGCCPDKQPERDKHEKPEEEDVFYIQHILYQLLLACTVYDKDVDYVVADGRVIIIDPHTGRLKLTSRWDYGLHTAMEVKEGVNVKYDSDSSAVISLKNYFKLYERLAGMSGTVRPVSGELKEVYGLNTAVIAPNRPCIRQDKGCRIYRTSEERDKGVAEEVRRLHREGRPVLVGCLSVRRAEAVHALLEKYELPSNLLSAKSLDREAYYISLAGREGNITVATGIAGRGTDIMLTAESREKGGLAVIGTDLFDNTRMDRQLMGRSGRQGDPGTSELYLSLEDTVMDGLTEEEKAEMYRTDPQENGNGWSAYVQKARERRETYYYHQRMNVARKDDVIAPYRKIFYEERNRILSDIRASQELVRTLYPTRSDYDRVQEHASRHYRTVHALLSRERAMNPSAEKMEIPFSQDMHLYVVRLDIDACLASETFFRQEYVRQVILGAYDKYWKRFVMYLKQKLDEEQIAGLPQRYQCMRDEIETIIRVRLTASTIPVGCNEAPREEKEPAAPVPEEEKKKRETANPEAPCPCGSGKKYGECHGLMDTRRKGKRRI